jgi:5-methyltetrahydropteroyltriglutamate--homocysteine methyltransferase
VKFGTCCSQVMALFLDIHTPKYRDKREVIWDMAEAMNKELLALRDAGCRCIQIEEPTFHFMANTYGKDHEQVKFMIDAFNREVQGLDDVELWIHTCWGNPNMQRVMEDTSYANSIEIYLGRCRGDVWTLEMKDRNQKDLELFAPFRNDLKKKIAIGAVSHRSLQADRPEDVAGEIRKALKFIPPERLVVSSDCGFGRQGANREIAFYKASAIAQGSNIVRRELGLATSDVPAADPLLQIDVVPGRDVKSAAQGPR